MRLEHEPVTRPQGDEPIILEAQFTYAPNISMSNAAKTTIETAAALFPGDPTIEQKTRQAFQAREIPLN